MRIDIHPDFLGESLARKKKAVGGVSDETAVELQEEAVAGRSPDFRKLLQSVYDAVLITDFRGRVEDYNTRALDFFLCDAREMAGAKVIELISGAANDLLDAIHRNLQDQRYTLIEAHCLRKDGSLFPCEIAVNRMDLESGAKLCFFVRDVTVRKKAEAALEDAVARLEAHDRARSEFISNVSHELRTPLTSMIYAISNMLRGVPDRVRRYLHMLEGDSKRLLNTVNDILDLRKIEAKSLSLSRARIPIHRLVMRAAESLRVQAEEKGLTFHLAPSSGRWFALCDLQKIERVVLNIVGNALKFTPRGGIVSVEVREDARKAGWAVIRVQDTGIGIPKEALGKVMQRYFTVGDPASGTGLGLAISKEIVELHGGTIEIRSPPPGTERGTVVEARLPLVEAPRVLVVEDEDGVRSVLERQMAMEGYRVTGARDGEEALARVEEEKPDVVVLDLVLPKMSGIEFILKMKGDKTTKRIPIIVVTGADLGRATVETLNRFSIPALAKPWEEAELLDNVEGALLGSAALAR
jgi:PAS domain S-box-containing protein